ncbi:MAG TPA: alkaline phosphatase family protein [Candidatus Thermoplasmatota archaeon]|nr:alkaline phosphatase family protein [Candidatus Thermoplasmatota archaeon]
MTTTPTFFLILDACRHDYITPETTPFLAALLERSRRGSLVSPAGFAQRTAMFTGTYPDKSGNFSAFGYGPENSPFGWLSKLGPLARWYRPRKVFFPVRLAIKHASRLITGKYHTDPAWIPPTFLPKFEVVEDSRPIFDPGALPSTSLFDRLREDGKTFFYGAHPVSGDDEEIFSMLLERFERRVEDALFVAQFSTLDENGHHAGPLLPAGLEPSAEQTDQDRSLMRRELAELDRKCRTIHTSLASNYGDFNFMVVGDHGMAPVRRRVDVLAALRTLDLEPGEDYTVFVNSTIANFWFETERARSEITSAMERLGGGRFLSRSEMEAERIGFSTRRYGDALFAADPGTLFWPDYFHVVDSTIKGMHGYIDKAEETYSLLMVSGPGIAPGEIGARPLVDVFPTLCRLTGVESTVDSEGRSLLDASLVRRA